MSGTFLRLAYSVAAASAALAISSASVGAGATAFAAEPRAAATAGMTWHPLPLIHGWASDAAIGTGRPSWAVKNGVVYLSGSLHQLSGSFADLAVLPRAARPARLVITQVYTSDDTNGWLMIYPTGEIYANSYPLYSRAQDYTSLAGVSYPAAKASGHALVLINGWKRSPGISDGAPSYMISGRVVYLTGALHQRNGNLAYFAVLPKAARPAHLEYIIVGTWGESPGVLKIFPDGNMLAYGGGARSRTWLGGVSFPQASLAGHKLSLTGGWQSAHGQNGDPSYLVRGGVVYLSGVLHQPIAGGQAFATLPRGARPVHSLYIKVYTYAGTIGTLFIQPNGLMQAYGPGVTDAQLYTSLAAVSFPLSS